jgi:hypothetical protein
VGFSGVKIANELVTGKPITPTATKTPRIARHRAPCDKLRNPIYASHQSDCSVVRPSKSQDFKTGYLGGLGLSTIRGLFSTRDTAFPSFVLKKREITPLSGEYHVA